MTQRHRRWIVLAESLVLATTDVVLWDRISANAYGNVQILLFILLMAILRLTAGRTGDPWLIFMGIGDRLPGRRVQRKRDEIEDERLRDLRRRAEVIAFWVVIAVVSIGLFVGGEVDGDGGLTAGAVDRIYGAWIGLVGFLFVAAPMWVASDPPPDDD